MKKIIFVSSSILSFSLFAQTSQTVATNQISDSLKVVLLVKELNDYFSMMSTWTPEEIAYFKENFVYTRGNFTIPKKTSE